MLLGGPRGRRDRLVAAWPLVVLASALAAFGIACGRVGVEQKPHEDTAPKAHPREWQRIEETNARMEDATARTLGGSERPTDQRSGRE